MLDTQYLRRRRRQEGLRLVDMAEKLGYASINGFWLLEQGITKPRVEHLVKLSKIFEEPYEKFIR